MPERTCPECGAVYDRHAEFCPEDGAELEIGVPERSAEEERISGVLNWGVYLTLVAMALSVIIFFTERWEVRAFLAAWILLLSRPFFRKLFRTK